MKKTIYLILFTILIALPNYAQQGINYKAVIKDGNGNLITNDLIAVQLEIREVTSTGSVVFTETHTPTTDANGLIILTIGSIGTGFDTIDWESDKHFLNVQVDIGGGFVDLNTTEFHAVPYALNALTSSDNYWSKNGNDIYTSNNEVGINSANPEHTLDVRSTSQSGASGFNLSNSDKSRNLRFFSGSDSFPDPSLSWVPGNNLLFATFDDNTGAFSEKVRISSDGDVGIGTNNPSARLDVSSTGNTGIYSQTDLATGSAIEALNTSTTGDAYGMEARTNSSTGTALYAYSASGSGDTKGIKVDVNSPDGVGIQASAPKYGVYGFASAANNIGIGVRGRATGIAGQGVKGEATGTDGIALFGEATGANGIGIYGEGDIGLWATTDSNTGPAIYARSSNLSGSTTGIQVDVDSPDGIGVQASGPKYGVYGFASAANPNGIGLRGRAGGIAGHGVKGEAIGTDGIGVYGDATGADGIGLYGEGDIGLWATTSSTGPAIYAYNQSLSGSTMGIDVDVNSPDGIGIQASGSKYGVYGFASAANSNGRGLYGIAGGANGQGVRGEAHGESGKAFYGEATGLYGKGIQVVVTSTNSSANAILAQSGGGSSYAGYFVGRVHVAGVLSKSSGSFKIDHPLDPENKYLSHSFVESPDMMNIYNGNVTTNKDGKVIVDLPHYFDVLNIDFRYQLTVIGQFAQAIISKKINNNSFEIQTNKPNVEVSWQVTGVRNDAFAKKNRIKVEEDKEIENIGTYLNPEVYNQKASNIIGNQQ